VGVTCATASRWKELVDDQGIAGLAAKPRPARATRLSLDQREKLVEVLLQGPMAAGFPTDMWTCQRVAKIIRSEFGISYHPGHVWKILHSLGWTVQLPEQKSRKRDEKAIKRWREQQWARIKKRLKKGAQSS
jgi:transposase